MLALPTPFRLPHRRLVKGLPDAHNNPQTSFELSRQPLVAHGIQGPLEELSDVLRDDATVHDKVVLAPKQDISVGDQLQDEGEWYDVVGVTDWTRGPWAHPIAGLEIKIKKVDG